MKYLINTAVILLFTFTACNTNDPQTDGLGGNPTQLKLIGGDLDSSTITLKQGESAIINDNIKISFKGLVSDSRCPIDAMCIWAGNAAVEIKITTDQDNFTTTLNTFASPKSVWVKGILIELKEVLPYPYSQEHPKPEDYSITLGLKLSNDIPVENYVQLIDAEDSTKINKDMIYFNTAEIINDELKLNISYGGGCTKHIVELFAFKAIEKTNPPRVSVRISHNANNDMCEAFITDEIEFDLKGLKDYMITNYNVPGVELVLYGTEGKPLDKTLKYDFPQ